MSAWTSCRRPQLVVAFVLLLLIGGHTEASPIVSHRGDVDPLAEGFGLWPYNGGMITAPLCPRARSSAVIQP